MFYPEESLKRGGRFYLCWVADSWPLRFATITHRQLWSQDIRKICDDLLEVMTNESGRPANRFSLRLSSQLMRGLVRLYQRKVTVFLGDLCMINAHVTKNVNKKWNINEVEVVSITRQPLPQLPPPVLVQEPEAEPEQRIEEIIRNSGNIVSNIQDITLKETTVPEIVLPPNDNFGEENPDHFLKDQTIEMMLMQDRSAAHLSGLALDVSDKSHDKSHEKSRRAHDAAQMERISEHDITFRKSTVGDRITMGELEKDVPEIPEILLPDLPIPQPEMQVVEPQTTAVPEQVATEVQLPRDVQPVPATFDIELEELEEMEPRAKRRRLKKLIIDKNIKLSADYLMARINNPRVELRCEDSASDRVGVANRLASVDALFGRPCAPLGAPLLAMFRRAILGINSQEAMLGQNTSRLHTRSLLDRIEEEPVAPVPDPVQMQVELPSQLDVTKEAYRSAIDPQNVTIPVEQVDLSDLPTQKISQPESRKRSSEYNLSSGKRPRASGYVSFRQSHVTVVEAMQEQHPTVDIEKENFYRTTIQSPQGGPIDPNILQEIDINILHERDSHVLHQRDTNLRTNDTTDRSVTRLLEEAGLADLSVRPPSPVVMSQVVQRTARKADSDSSETPLGSLDRTKVSLGDSIQTTDSRRFIRDQWGTEGSLLKIMQSIRGKIVPVTVKSLISKGPIITGYKSIMAARCFTSILKLKQHGFIKVKKDPNTLEILDINLGSKLKHLKA